MASQKKIAVLFVHGVEIADRRLADEPMRLLRDRFTQISGVSADDALAVRAVLWGPEAHRRQEDLFQRCLGPNIDFRGGPVP